MRPRPGSTGPFDFKFTNVISIVYIYFGCSNATIEATEGIPCVIRINFAEGCFWVDW